jgi:hypothetical protein
MIEHLLFLVFGSISTLVGVWISAWLQRSTASSSHVFERRLAALTDLWTALVEVQQQFVPKIPKGHAAWKEESYEAALSALNRYRTALEVKQILLDADVVVALRDLDIFFYLTLDEDEQKPSAYIAEHNRLIKALERAVQRSMRQRIHHVTLEPSPPRQSRADR